MVTFSPQIRYSTALKQGNKQQAIMDKIMALPDIESLWESNEIEKEMLNQLG